MPADYLRLRQVCLAARDMQRAETLFTQVLGLSVAFRDPRVERYGLQNIILPIGTSFIEVVVPIEPDTAVGRFLDRFGERRGYMAIFDCADLAAARARAEAMHIRILHSRKWPRYENLQLHPRDTGAALLEFHHNLGGDEPTGYYEPAGEDWQRHIRDDIAVSLLGAEFTAPDPQALANRWSRLFGRPATAGPERAEIMLDAGRLTFLPGSPDEQLNALDIKVQDVDAVMASAASHGCRIEGNSIDLCGVWFRLQPHLEIRKT